MSRLTLIDKKIIASRLYDRGIIVSLEDLDNYIVDHDLFNDLNSMYNSIVNNFGRLIIAL